MKKSGATAQEDGKKMQIDHVTLLQTLSQPANPRTGLKASGKTLCGCFHKSTPSLRNLSYYIHFIAKIKPVNKLKHEPICLLKAAGNVY